MNEGDALRLEKMAALMNANLARAYLEDAYKLGHLQGKIDGMNQARELVEQDHRGDES